MGDSPETLGGVEMTDREVDAFLREQGVGVLSLARGSEAYGVPVSFGYDGDRLYFVFLLAGEESRKEALAERTERASFLAYEIESRYRWRSVVAAGPIREVGDEEWPALRAAIEANAWYPDLFSRTDPMRGVGGRVLEIDEVSGIRSTGTD